MDSLRCARLQAGRPWQPQFQSVHLLAETLTALFTATLSAQAIPQSWATSAVTPIYKKGDAVDTANYRPVAVGTPIARLYASVINNRISP